MPRKHKEHFDYDEESIEDKAKKGASIFTLVGLGILSILHVLSHLVPAIAVLGFFLGDKYDFFYGIVSNEYMQLSFVVFVFISFWYMYRDHKHHQHERELRRENNELRRKINQISKRR